MILPHGLKPIHSLPSHHVKLSIPLQSKTKWPIYSHATYIFSYCTYTLLNISYHQIMNELDQAQLERKRLKVLKKRENEGRSALSGEKITNEHGGGKSVVWWWSVMMVSLVALWRLMVVWDCAWFWRRCWMCHSASQAKVCGRGVTGSGKERSRYGERWSERRWDLGWLEVAWVVSQRFGFATRCREEERFGEGMLFTGALWWGWRVTEVQHSIF